LTERDVAEEPSALAAAPAPPFALLPPPASPAVAVAVAVAVADSPGAPFAVTDRPVAERPDWTMTLRVDDFRILVTGG
jgi:hypothetical protein